jgi:serine/threonine-protein kinase
MEYVAGLSLDEVLTRGGPLAPDRTGRLLSQLCWVLEAAHAATLLHRDISCNNILVVAAGAPSEQLKVIDFGLAQLGAGPHIALEKLTGSGHSIGAGTPDYLSPEQIAGREIDQRADLYSVGVVLFKMLTGHLPFGNFSETRDILLAHAELDPPAFVHVNVDVEVEVDPAVEAVVRSCLAKNPQERPASARELARSFQNALGQEFLEWESVVVALPPASAQRETQVDIDLAGVLAQMDAWMPECIAVMKLRGFVAELGGEVIESVPGLIRMKIPTPAPMIAPPPRKRFWPFLGRTLPPPEPPRVLLELHLQKNQANPNHLQVTAVLPPDQDDCLSEAGELCKFYEKICFTLRAYLMTTR